MLISFADPEAFTPSKRYIDIRFNLHNVLNNNCNVVLGSDIYRTVKNIIVENVLLHPESIVVVNNIANKGFPNKGDMF